MQAHKVVSQDEWTSALKEHLTHEKAFTRQRDRLAAKRRALPWVRIDAPYVFEGPNGRETLSDLFAGRSQLIVKHFMLAPGQQDPCIGCSFEADHIGGALVHLEHHDVSYVAVARAPYSEIARVQARMGWTFKWVSSFGTDFNYDFNVSFRPEGMKRGRAFYNFEHCDPGIEDLSGHTILARDESGAIFKTFAAFGRGAEELLSTYVVLDMTPKGRNETGPRRNLTDWVRLHDRYDHAGDGRGNAGRRTAPCCE